MDARTVRFPILHRNNQVSHLPPGRLVARPAEDLFCPTVPIWHGAYLIHRYDGIQGLLQDGPHAGLALNQSGAGFTQ